MVAVKRCRIRAWCVATGTATAVPGRAYPYTPSRADSLFSPFRRTGRLCGHIPCTSEPQCPEIRKVCGEAASDNECGTVSGIPAMRRRGVVQVGGGRKPAPSSVNSVSTPRRSKRVPRHCRPARYRRKTFEVDLIRGYSRNPHTTGRRRRSSREPAQSQARSGEQGTSTLSRSKFTATPWRRISLGCHAYIGERLDIAEQPEGKAVVEAEGLSSSVPRQTARLHRGVDVDRTA